VVNGPGDLLLAGAGFALDQHRGRRMGHVVDQLEDGVHLRVFAEDVVERELALELGAQTGHLVAQGALAHGPLNDQTQVVDVDRFGEEIVRTQADRLHRLLDSALAGGDDHRDRPVALLDVFNELHAAHAGQAQIGDDDAVMVLRHVAQGLLAVRGDVQLEERVNTQQGLQLPGGQLVVLDN
jgi:hypothetical protein